MRSVLRETLAKAICQKAGINPYDMIIGHWWAPMGDHWVEEYGFHPQWQSLLRRADELLPRNGAERDALLSERSLLDQWTGF